MLGFQNNFHRSQIILLRNEKSILAPSKMIWTGNVLVLAQIYFGPIGIERQRNLQAKLGKISFQFARTFPKLYVYKN